MQTASRTITARLARYATLTSIVIAMAPAGLGAQRDPRMMSAERVVLEIDGMTVPFVKSLEGGGTVGDVVVISANSQEGVSRKHIGAVHVEDITAEVGIGMGKPLYDWIAGSWTGTSVRKNGAVVIADFNYKARTRRDFENAILTSTTFPTLDGSSKEAGYIKVTITPERVVQKAGGGEDIRGKLAAKQKAWLTSNFRFELGELPTNRVARIESFTVGQRRTADAVGAFREHAKSPGGVEFPNLKISVSAADADAWTKWHEDFVIKGENGDDREKSGAIILLGPDMKQELGRVVLQQCGIFRLAPDRSDAAVEQIARLTAELYCERMQFQLKDFDVAIQPLIPATVSREAQ